MFKDVQYNNNNINNNDNNNNNNNNDNNDNNNNNNNNNNVHEMINIEIKPRSKEVYRLEQCSND